MTKKAFIVILTLISSYSFASNNVCLDYAKSSCQSNDYLSYGSCVKVTFNSCMQDIGVGQSLESKGQCIVVSRYSELEVGINKDVICEETLRAITGSTIIKADKTIVIELNSGRSTYTVDISSISYFNEQEMIYAGRGMMKWNPEDSYVEITR